MHLGVSFLNHWYPDLMRINASSEYSLTASFANRSSIIDDDVDPLEVLEDSNDVQANRSESVEDWWINTVGQ